MNDPIHPFGQPPRAWLPPEKFRVRIYELKTKHCHVESRDASEGEAAVVMETVKARNGWGFVALITPEEETSGK